MACGPRWRICGIVLAWTVASVGAAAADEPTPASAGDSAAGGDEPADTTSAAEDLIVVPAIEVRGDTAGRRGRQAGVGRLVSDDPVSIDAGRGLDDPAFVTVVRIDEQAGETTSVAEVLARSMGVHVRSLGGLGSFSSLSVRGAASGHSTVLIDGVPLSRVASVSADLGRYELESFSAIELYRGMVPAEYGGATLGGAVNLITRMSAPPSGRELRVSAGLGSFGARRARARWLGSRGDGRHTLHVSLGYAGADGDFVYFNDQGTNLNQSDDEFVERTNNGYDQVDGVARYRGELGDLTLEGGARWLWKRQGIPGSASVQSETASLYSSHQLVDVHLTKKRLFGSTARGTSSAFVSLEQQHYRDLDGEIGLGVQDRRYRSVSAGAAARVANQAGLGRLAHTMSAGVDARLDYFVENDALAMPDAGLRTHGLRVGAGVDAKDEVSVGAADRLILQAALRLDVLHTVPISDRNTPVEDPALSAPRTDIQPSPRLAVRGRVRDGVVVKGSAGWYFRAPTLVELFGDRGFVVGNPHLASETGLSGDVGLVMAPSEGLGPVDRIYVESALFARRARDTIAFVTSGGLVAHARNLGDSWAYGLETGGSVRLWKTATLSGSYTRLDTRQDSPLPSFDGKPLPVRPKHQVYARVDVAREIRGRLLLAWADLTAVSGNFLDAAGLSPVPARRLIGAGIKIEPVPGLLLGLEANNLTDQRVERVELTPPPRPDLSAVPRAVADFFGYPLPGRAFYLSAEWRR